MLADLARGATIAAVPLLYRAGMLQFWQLVLLVFLLASVNSNGDTARFGLVPFVAGRAQMSIERANGADRAIIRMGTVLGPVLGGFLIAALGAANVLFVDTVTFMISAIVVAVGVPGAANRAGRTEGEGGRSYLAELAEGLRFIRAHTVLLSMILIATVGNFLDKPLMAVILPSMPRPSTTARPAWAWRWGPSAPEPWPARCYLGPSGVAGRGGSPS